MICCIFNYAPHYRKAIFKKLDKELDCSFYFGDTIGQPLKKLDYNELKGFVKEVENSNVGIKGFKWQKNVIFLPFHKKYKYFILTGDISLLSNFFILLFCWVLNKKAYLWMHGLYEKPKFKQKLLMYPHYCLAKGFFLYGNLAKNLLKKEGFSENKLHVIYNSLDYEKQLKLREQVLLSNIYRDYFENDNPVLMYIGRIQKVKRIDYILEAIGRLKEYGRYYNFVIIGEACDSIELEDIIAKYDLSKQVWFYGASYQEDKNAELIYNADLCVSPGNIGLTVIHSFMYGTPCITHNDFSLQMPEYEIIEEGRTGCFFEKDNIDDLAYCIDNWFYMYSTSREKIREKCYKKVDDYYNPSYQIKIIKKALYEGSMDS